MRSRITVENGRFVMRSTFCGLYSTQNAGVGVGSFLINIF